ncbi:cytochrome P450 family protein [Streptomyces millisiae]|uniref:Uncharacterized protein n=1 Tax=Streptomyces millisiae TaxID=3075542 RepID=A0ABU2LH92_9ACTN|nr:hypothetical protein [Streptomyces sp. DSM 44918]MDT0316957.1 hypothetical protein [Streptomyces sp. DSM 44918]
MPQERGRAAGALRDYLRELVTGELADPGDDLLSGLAGPIRTGEVSIEEATGTGVLLLVAGHEPSASMIARGTTLLLQHNVLFDAAGLRAASPGGGRILGYVEDAADGKRSEALTGARRPGGGLMAEAWRCRLDRAVA